MDNQVVERFHEVDLKLKDHESRQDSFERLLEEQAKAFSVFQDMINTWAKRFAYIIIGIAGINLSDGDGASVVLTLVGKVFGL